MNTSERCAKAAIVTSSFSAFAFSFRDFALTVDKSTLKWKSTAAILFNLVNYSCSELIRIIEALSFMKTDYFGC